MRRSMARLLQAEARDRLAKQTRIVLEQRWKRQVQMKRPVLTLVLETTQVLLLTKRPRARLRVSQVRRSPKLLVPTMLRQPRA